MDEQRYVLHTAASCGHLTEFRVEHILLSGDSDDKQLDSPPVPLLVMECDSLKRTGTASHLTIACVSSFSWNVPLPFMTK